MFLLQQRQRALLKQLWSNGFYPLSDHRILELGPGNGGVLIETLGFGASAVRLHGAELLFDRVQTAHHALVASPLVCADGQNLPYPAQSFDLTMQFTVFSSILDEEVRMRVARELLRVTRPHGMILSYDFWLNPANRQTRGIRQAEIRRLFPDCRFTFERITLAPPITRRLASISWGLCIFLESPKIFNTHYLVTIRRSQE